MENSSNHKHLEFIQAVINRMSGYLFLIRGWCVTLIAGLFALAAKDTNKAYILVAYLPLVPFWMLDGYYLSVERCYRALYNSVIAGEQIDPQFSLDVSKYASEKNNSWLQSVRSPTLLVFYLGLALIITLLFFVVR